MGSRIVTVIIGYLSFFINLSRCLETSLKKHSQWTTQKVASDTKCVVLYSIQHILVISY